MLKPQIFKWRNISNAPASPGIYAWYYNNNIGKANVKKFINDVNRLVSKGEAEARDYVEKQLELLVFKKFNEAPYDVKITGKMKPKYEGVVRNGSQISDSLIDRLVENPSRFESICDVISSVAPSFTAPLYIGMAKSLKTRLGQHKRSIVRLKDKTGLLDEDNEDDTISGFAQQVVSRGFNPENLFVCIHCVDDQVKEQNDIENILNRINFPIFGRN